MSSTATPLATSAATDPTQTAGAPAPRVVAMTTTHGAAIAHRDAHGRIMAGSNLNPTGRPMGLARRVREMVDFDMAITTLVDIAWGKLAPASRVADRIKAIELLFDRGHGKAAQTIDIKDTSTAGKSFRQMPTEKLIATVEALRRVAAGADEHADDAELVQ